ncbi:MAG TPA: serine hydrolase [Candidatus Eisenbacteria bacterium]|nr:serine hydrolase [Candidatus Eisenbacteria bacterium]
MVTVSSPAWFPSDSEVRAMLQQRIDVGQGTGLVVGLLEGGETRIIACGKSDGAGERPLDGATVFEIGSVTKVFTAATLADMVRRGEVQLHQPVAELLPKSVTVPTQPEREITLVDLATQHSGLPRMPSNVAPRDPANPYADYSVEQLYEFLSHYELTRTPGNRYEYSNLGFGLLGHALALKAGKPYEALVIERVLDPLGMNDTRITLTPEMKARLAAGHDVGGARVPNWDFPTLPGAGALRSTANDLLRFLAANLDSNASAISADLRACHVPRLEAGGPNVKIGLAWHMLDNFGAVIHMHNGGTGGYRSFIGYDPAIRVGVVLLANAANDIDDLALHLLNPRYPIKTFVKHEEVRVGPERLALLDGEYSLAPTFVLTVTHEGDRMFVQATGQSKLQAFAESDTSFFFKAVEARVTFVRDASGRGAEITLHQNGRSAPGKRVR